MSSGRWPCADSPTSIIYAADDAELESVCQAQRARLAESSGAVVELPGSVQRGYRPDTASEPFGFHDGISQPAIAGLTEGGVPTGEFILGYERESSVRRCSMPGSCNACRVQPPVRPSSRCGTMGTRVASIFSA